MTYEVVYYTLEGKIHSNVRVYRDIIKGAEAAAGVPYDSPTNKKQPERG
jgi:hypothetical protein